MAGTRHIGELLELAERGALDMATLEALAAQRGSSVSLLTDELLLHVARLYDSGDLDFGRADQVMNWVWALLCSQPAEVMVIPPVTLDVYGAFDQGEYYHPEDSRDVDPEEKYTKPMIQAVLREHSGDGA
jgi:hypothetical protein